MDNHQAGVGYGVAFTPIGLRINTNDGIFWDLHVVIDDGVPDPAMCADLNA